MGASPVPLPQDLRLAWQHGVLRWKLDSMQQGIYDAYYAARTPMFVLDVARRVGKSTLDAILACEQAMRRPRSRIPFGAPTQTQIKEYILPIFDWVLEDCPNDLRPRYLRNEFAYQFRNGSRIILVGCDMYPDRLRGPALDLGILDEAAFIEGLEYTIKSVLVPQMQGRPHARLLLSSTPPKSPAHYWSKVMVPDAKAGGYHVHRTIHDNPRLSAAEIEFFTQIAGGTESTDHKRENLAQHVADENVVVLPEFSRYRNELVVDPGPAPEHYDAYVGMDVGFNDLTVVLFGYYDFHRTKIVISDELVLNRMTTLELAEGIKEHEASLGWPARFPQSRAVGPRLLRVSDVAPIVTHDLTKLHGLHFLPTRKDDKEAAVNEVRLAMHHRKLEIHPRCKTLVDHCETAIWNDQRTEFARQGEARIHHFDAVDALVYLVRNVDRAKNPWPSVPGHVTSPEYIIPRHLRTTEQERNLVRAFKGPLTRYNGRR